MYQSINGVSLCRVAYIGRDVTDAVQRAINTQHSGAATCHCLFLTRLYTHWLSVIDSAANVLLFNCSLVNVFCFLCLFFDHSSVLLLFI